MSDLLEPLFGDAEVSAHFADTARLQAMLDVEAALAAVEVALGVIPASAAGPIRIAAQAGLYDQGAIARRAAQAGNLAIPLVAELTQRVATIDPDAARHVHWGATSQDILDTGLVLQLRAAVPLIVRQLDRCVDAAAEHARRHAATPMPGRTWLQHATPITFGVKAAGWCDALGRARDRLAGALTRALVLQLGGASGTLAALGDKGIAVLEALANELSLAAPAIPWHAHRDRLVDLACALGLATGTLGKIGRDLSLLAQSEVGEAFEAAPGGSSTMPQKRNPLAASIALAAAARAPGLVATLLGAMPQEHERGVGGWQAEWDTLPALVRIAGGAARAIADALAGLVVDTARMRANLDVTHGLIYAEAVAMALAQKVGKHEAHSVVAAACERAVATGRSLRDVLTSDPRLTAHLSAADLAPWFEPDAHQGAAPDFVARVVRAVQAPERSERGPGRGNA